jgi:hypothetical protein
MPTKTLCERCDAPLDESMNWCARCFFTAPWAPESWDTPQIDTSDWPDIWEWEREPDPEPAEQEDVIAFANTLKSGAATFWSLPRAMATVALLVGLATISALFIPMRVVGLVSLLSLGTVALLVVRRAWLSEPTEG